MDPATGLVVAGGIGGVLNYLGGSSARAQAKEQAQQQMDFQERMSSTAYQRATKDMQAAGLNPALMYGSGGPESTPSGASAPIQNILGDAADEVTHSASDAIRLQKDIDETESRISLNSESAKTEQSTRFLQDAQKEAARASARLTNAEAVGKELDANLLSNNKWIATIDAISKRVLPWAR